MERHYHMNNATYDEKHMHAVDATLGTSGLQTIVHKADHEGAITIDPLTGQVTSPLSDKPEWAEELAIAQVAERHRYYGTALGPLYTADMKMPEAMAFEDLSWLCVRPLPEGAEPTLDADGQPELFEQYVQDADEQFRSNFVAQATGIEQDIDLEEGTIADIMATAEITRDNTRSAEELAALEESQQQKFSKVSGE